jgi:hypothetical protein
MGQLQKLIVLGDLGRATEDRMRKRSRSLVEIRSAASMNWDHFVEKLLRWVTLQSSFAHRLLTSALTFAAGESGNEGQLCST